MLKNISNLGKTLNKEEQKEINGGRLQSLSIAADGFPCSCNGTSLGNKNTVAECVAACNACTTC